ncbi:MAG: response regulator [Chitinophagaceae bacterium]
MDPKVNGNSFRIILADDDFEDFQFIRNAFRENDWEIHLSHVEDGQYLIDILNAQSKYNKLGELPHLILLDLNMPRKHGLEVLKEIKENLTLRKIPVLIFSTSYNTSDIQKAYELGANCYVTKPQTVSEWSSTIQAMGRFWIQCVKLPT